MKDERYVVEWSQSSNGVHIQPLRYAIQGVQRRFLENRPAPNDYEVIFVADSHDEACRFADGMRPIRHEREISVKDGE